MLKISTIDSRTQHRLILEGKLVAPWVAELKSTCESSRAALHGRELVIEMKHVTTISQEGENALVELMKDGAKFHSCDVFTKHVVKQLSRRVAREVQETK